MAGASPKAWRSPSCGLFSLQIHHALQHFATAPATRLYRDAIRHCLGEPEEHWASAAVTSSVCMQGVVNPCRVPAVPHSAGYNLESALVSSSIRVHESHSRK